MRHELYIALADSGDAAALEALMALAQLGCRDFRDVWVMAAAGDAGRRLSRSCRGGPEGRSWFVPAAAILSLSAECSLRPRELGARMAGLVASPSAGSLRPLRRVEVPLSVRTTAWLNAWWPG